LGFHIELEKWIVAYLVIHPHYTINTGRIINHAPRSLVIQISSDQELFRFLMNMQTKRIIRKDGRYNFKLTTQGKLYFRKFIEPLFIIAKDKKRYTQIINETEGTRETKNSFKKLLNSIKDELPDEAEKMLVQSLTKVSIETIFYLIRLVVTTHVS